MKRPLAMQEQFSDSWLRGIPPFSTLSATQLTWIRSSLETHKYRAGSDIFVQGQAADALVIMLSGQALLFRTNEDGSQQPLGTIAAGQSINHQALLGEVLQSATLRSSQPVTLAKLTRTKFTELVAQYPELASALGMLSGKATRRVNPSFAEQRDDEEVLIQTHRHWWAFLHKAWLPLIVMPPMCLAVAMVESQVLSLAILLLSVLLPGIVLIVHVRRVAQ